ncbi:hypothetical protein OPT61_g8307 [Boeremia exigua]|uniref:Uncharacterized protein n=1 Tax=Boeremia exigua TaxID=749465 RepID=A0ACC2I0E6_9PLEO|nr:hypothetical protein OPT61_g8307 [Boeremia exigua]
MLVVPDLAQHGVSIISGALTRGSSVEARPGAADEGNRAVLLGQRLLEVGVRVGGAVGGDDVLCLEPLEGREALVEFYRGFEEVDYFFVLAVLRAVARRVEGAEAGGVLAELVGPESGVVLVLRDPVRVHVLEQVVAAKGLEEGPDVGAGIRGDDRAVGEARGGVGGGYGVVLACQVAVLRIFATTKIWPQAVQPPSSLRQQLAFCFAAGVGAPELGGEDEAAKGLDAA